MSEVKHAPGPWAYRKAKDHGGYEIDALFGWFGFARVERFEDFDHDDADQTRENDEESLANARLIAAAPELLEALEGLTRLARLHQVDGYSTAMLAARDAIAKAKGGDACS